MRLYIAAPIACAHDAQSLAASLASVGHTIDSRWHDVATIDPDDHRDRLSALAANLVDLDAADVLIAQMTWGNPRATNCEIGYALAKGKRVIWLDWSGARANANIFDAHPLVIGVRDVTECINALTRMQRAARDTLPGVEA